MYAIIEVGAKQYSVKKDDFIDVEKENLEEGKEINLTKVLLVSKDNKVEIGRPYIKEASVRAIAIKQLKDAKLVSFKYRRRKSSHWKKGHRQSLTRLQIKEIKFG